MKVKKITNVLILLFFVMSLSSCAPNHYESNESGFFSGIWHGIIIVFSIIGKLFGFNIGIYAEHNTGFTYWLGFIIGIGAFGGGSSSARQ
ncbi:hypothetical protein CLU81_4147 [Flavobacterium sp. 9]|uniref:hypothetical protein n=1 Tax=Flavobacterium sp. 9 TaxID=2035198 RepID=UPI000C5B75CC|nr:hypothetical protein [Flavobacterium sp. 9]PIF33531.1 hypothetical protein CLU81_4147 [Flavobacterium sp. 9]